MAISEEIKRKAVEKALEGHSYYKIAMHLTNQGISVAPETVKRWKQKYADDVKAEKERASIIAKHIHHHEAQAPQVTARRVLAIPDMHHPFCHPDALPFLREVRSVYKTDAAVCLGDEIDAHGYSRYPKDPDGMSAGQELRAAIESLIPFYLEFPEMMVCVSNHTIRPRKMMKEMGISRALWPAYETMLNAPDGWKWQEHWIIDNARYMHGDQGRGGKHGWTMNSEVYHQSVIVGHWHARAGVYYDSNMFNLNAGCLIDDSAYAFEFARQNHKKPNIGCGVVIDGREAHFVPMHLDGHKRWIGKLSL